MRTCSILCCGILQKKKGKRKVTSEFVRQVKAPSIQHARDKWVWGGSKSAAHCPMTPMVQNMKREFSLSLSFSFFFFRRTDELRRRRQRKKNSSRQHELINYIRKGKIKGRGRGSVERCQLVGCTSHIFLFFFPPSSWKCISIFHPGSVKAFAFQMSSWIPYFFCHPFGFLIIPDFFRSSVMSPPRLATFPHFFFFLFTGASINVSFASPSLSDFFFFIFGGLAYYQSTAPQTHTILMDSSSFTAGWYRIRD